MSSRHPRLRTLPDGLFRGLLHFRELEGRIVGLPGELLRGDAFEVFVEAYLWLTTVWQVQDLWLVGQVPLAVRQALNLPADAKGIDGVFRTRSGVLVPYQVKHRIGRPQVGVTEVATFLGLTERATDRVLISNSNRYAGDVENRDHLRVVRGMDFDALTADDLGAIADWLDARPVTRTRHEPLPHQRQALADIAATLTGHDRATVVMACGTGKTLVGLWAAEQQASHSVLVLLPSLALLSQALGDWSRHTSWGERFEYLCVCSDPSVSREQDALQMRATDVPFHVDTDPAVVRRFLDRPSTGTVRVVFSTYHSSAVVAEGMKGLAPFDVGVFDEAHKTTGAKDTTFALALDDVQLPIRKRLFFTATPRHIDIRHRDREGDFRVVSMDDPAVYGPRAHTLNFAEAVSQGLICDYRVVVSVVDPSEVTAIALQHGITIVKGDLQATQWVANQIGISKAIQATSAQRVITFHSRVAQAQAFASDTARGIGQYLDGFRIAHVNGTLRAADRTDILAGFKDDQPQLVTNARCLTEGVDLPAVDMVAFCNPRRSRIDIIQSVGRAMRKPREGDKRLGYVVVPMLLAPYQADDLEEASRKTDWEDVVDVLAALREHDTRLEDLIRDAQIAKGRGEVFKPRVFTERLQVLGPLVALEVMERHIGANIVELIGVFWDEMYGRLLAYRDEQGDCNVQQNYDPDLQLGRWCSTQRRTKKIGTLSMERTARLDALGFVWEPMGALWEDNFNRLAAYKAQHGTCEVPDAEGGRGLRVWCTHQRKAKKSGTLSLERIARLEALEFAWEPFEAAWEDMVNRLAAYKAQHGNCDVPQDHNSDRQLGTWCAVQRHARKIGRHSAERIARLDALGFVWGPKKAVWEDKFSRLVAYKAQHGDCNVPRFYDPDTHLGTWCAVQRHAKKIGRHSAERIARLDALGFVWEPMGTMWEDNFNRLAAYKAQHGNCNVPKGRRGLWSWCTQQRKEKKSGTLSVERTARLDALGFVWEPMGALWEDNFNRLAAYKAQHGTCEVPDAEDGPRLRKWWERQRKAKKSGTLSMERIARLEALGFAWEPFEAAWEDMVNRLAAYKAHHGDCNVPRAYGPDTQLGRWCSRARNRARMSPDRKARLDALGFVWNRR